MRGDVYLRGTVSTGSSAGPVNFAVRRQVGAPADGEAGRREAVEHWSFLAGRGGYTVTPLDTRTGHVSATYCGDVDVDGLVYQVHRGPRRRIVQAWEDDEGTWQGRFGLTDGIWAVPVLPDPDPVVCPWCTDGPPDTLRLAGSGVVAHVQLLDHDACGCRW